MIKKIQLTAVSILISTYSFAQVCFKPNNLNAILTLNNAGIYFVTVTSAKQISTQKVIVNK